MTAHRGLTESITFYCIRRNTALDYSSKIGPKMARVIMGHNPDSTVMEKYFTVGRTMLPGLTALAILEAVAMARIIAP